MTLPTPGGDIGTWGDELNAFLLSLQSAVTALQAQVTALGSAGTDAGALTGTLPAARIADGSIVLAKLETAVQDSLALADSSVQDLSALTSTQLTSLAAQVGPYMDISLLGLPARPLSTWDGTSWTDVGDGMKEFCTSGAPAPTSANNHGRTLNPFEDRWMGGGDVVGTNPDATGLAVSPSSLNTTAWTVTLPASGRSVGDRACLGFVINTTLSNLSDLTAVVNGNSVPLTVTGVAAPIADSAVSSFVYTWTEDANTVFSGATFTVTRPTAGPSVRITPVFVNLGGLSSHVPNALAKSGRSIGAVKSAPTLVAGAANSIQVCLYMDISATTPTATWAVTSPMTALTGNAWTSSTAYQSAGASVNLTPSPSGTSWPARAATARSAVPADNTSSNGMAWSLAFTSSPAGTAAATIYIYDGTSWSPAP